MSILKRIAPPAISVLAITVLATALVKAVPASALPRTVANKTYDAWVVASFNPAGTAPFHDCFRFTANQLCIDGCGGTCGPFTEAPMLPGTTGTIWHAQNGCGGLGLGFIGTSVDGTAGVSTMGGEGLGHVESTNFGVTGAENPACTPDAGAAAVLNRYTKMAK